jgi:hypothetical protein
MAAGGDGGSSLTRLYIFVLMLNLIFPVMGYTFTTFAEQSERYELDLDQDSLMTIGINLVDGESHNFTYGNKTWVEYSLLNESVRARWDNFRLTGLIYQDGFRFQKQSAISKAFNSWITPYTVSVRSLDSNEWFAILRNETIIQDFDTEFNWSRFVLKDGHHVFITPRTVGDQNITKAVNHDGELNMTIAKSFEEAGERFNFWRFISWYGSLLIGDQSWGLPSMFSWIVRILAAISMFAMIMLTRELIGFS